MRSSINLADVVRGTLLAAAVYLAAASPGPARADADVLATVDGVPAVTVGDVRYYYRNQEPGPGSPPATADGVAEVVENLISAKILVREAEAAGCGDLEHVRKEIAAFRRRTLRELMFKTWTAESPPTEEELRAFFEADRKWRKYSFIICKNREEAEAARRELADGKTWDDVFAKYAVNEDKTTAGAFGTPLTYDGREASRAVFATAAGAYTPAVPANDGIRWYVYRIDKIVHGRTDEFEEARPGLNVAVSELKGLKRAWNTVAGLRASVTVTRNAEMWRTLITEPFAAFEARWGTRGAVLADAGGVPVFGDEFVFLMYDFLGLNAAGLDAYHARDPDDFAYVADRILTKLEDEALWECEAIRRGLDREETFLRACENYRAGLLADVFIAREFTAQLPPVPESDVQRYYEAHPEQFLISEMLECYIIALPDRDLVRAFHERVVAGESIVDVGETYNHKRGRELADAYEAPPRLPPEKEDFVRAIKVYREPNPEEPELPLAADLRERVFASPEPGTLSDVFPLRDGRWAFYEVTYYRPPGKMDLSEEGTQARGYELARAEYLSSEEVNQRGREWLAALRAKHDVTVARGLFADVAASLNPR